MLGQLLESDPHLTVVELAEDAEEADGILSHEPVDVMTLDVEMPGIGGLAYLRDIAGRAHAKVIMLSGRTARGQEIRIDALQAGAVGCFDKAHALKRKADLIAMIKAAALGKLKVDNDDKAELRKRQCA
jgi:two-component system chemotaxis response regulator CheB